MRRLPTLVIVAIAFAAGIAITFLAMHRRANDAGASANTATAPAEKAALYWYDPMVPQQHFDKPGKSPFMDMQLVPKYAGGDTDAAGVVSIDPHLVQNLGARTVKAERGALGSTVRVSGSVAFDERAVALVQARVNGIIETLAVRAPQTAVKQGQTLLTLIAPDWTAAQEEYLSLQRSHSEGLEDYRDAARRRLLLLGMSEAQIRAIEHGGQAQARITVSAPRDGVVSELMARDGATVTAGSPLLRINGLDTVWINAAIPEAQIGRVAAGATVEVTLPAFPGQTIAGTIDALLPDIDAATRTQMARIVLPNPDHRLAPGMFANVRIAPDPHAEQSVLVPTEAVIATGARNVVIVSTGEGSFRAQEVRLGDEVNGKTAILEGIDEGDAVVLSGQFLIDSEASLSGTLARLADRPDGSGDAKSADAPVGAGKHTSYASAGTVEKIDGDHWTIATEAMPSLEMGAMSMVFVCPNTQPSGDIRVGQHVHFSFFRNDDGAFEIEKIAVDGATSSSTPGSAP